MKLERKTIWVVDDDTSLKQLLKDVLEREGYKVVPMGSSSEIYKKMENHKPHLIILDVLLGKENGIKICRRLKSFVTIPIILISGTKFKNIEVLTSCADSFIAKPFTLTSILETVDSLT